MKDFTLLAALIVLQTACSIAMAAAGITVAGLLFETMGYGAAFMGVATACATALCVFPAADELHAGLRNWLGD